MKRIDVEHLRDLRALKNYVVLDLETTGLDRENDDVIEIGLVFIENRSRGLEFESQHSDQKFRRLT